MAIGGRCTLLWSNVAVRITLNDRDVVEVARIALGCVGPTVFRVVSAEQKLEGHALDPDRIVAAAREARAKVTPISDHRGGADYRAKMTEVLVQRALTQTMMDLKGTHHV